MNDAQLLGQLQPKEVVILKAGTIVRVGGHLFRLAGDTQVEGYHSSLLQQGAMGHQTPIQGGFGIAKQSP